MLSQERKIYDTSLTYSFGAIMIWVFIGDGQPLFPEFSNIQYLQSIYSQGKRFPPTHLTLLDNSSFLNGIWEEESSLLNIEAFKFKLPFKTVAQKACSYNPIKRMKILRKVHLK